MDSFSLDDMFRGWFVGDCHKVATEITVIVSGTACMNGKEYAEGTILRMEPGEYAQFSAVTDVTTVVVKFPSVPGDKYLR